MPKAYNAGSWALVPLGIYFMPVDAPQSLFYFDFATRKIRPVVDVNKIFSDPSVSPDGRWILYTQMSEDNADIMLIEHLR